MWQRIKKAWRVLRAPEWSTGKWVYVAHPIRGDIPGNLQKLMVIRKEIIQMGHIPVIPYLAPLEILRDYVEEERTQGMLINFAYLRSGMVDEIWLYGDTVSAGMWAEIRTAVMVGIRVVPKTPGTLLACQHANDLGLMTQFMRSVS